MAWEQLSCFLGDNQPVAVIDYDCFIYLVCVVSEDQWFAGILLIYTLIRRFISECLIVDYKGYQVRSFVILTQFYCLVLDYFNWLLRVLMISKNGE